MRKCTILTILLIAVAIPFIVVSAANEPVVVELQNPLGEGRTDMRVIIGEIIAKALGVMGSLALVVFIYGGFMWLTAGGNDEKVKKGSQAMLWAVIGIFIIFSSYAILTLVLKGIGAGGVQKIAEIKSGLCIPKGSELCVQITEPQKCKDSVDKCSWVGGKCFKGDEKTVLGCAALAEENKCIEAGCIWILPKE